MPVSSKEFLDIQATIEDRFTLKCIHDMVYMCIYIYDIYIYIYIYIFVDIYTYILCIYIYKGWKKWNGGSQLLKTNYFSN